MLENFRKNILQGEILILLHDIGKLHWRFVGPASGQVQESKGFKLDYSARHTLLFLAESNEACRTQDQTADDFRKAALDQVAKEPASSLSKALLSKISWLEMGDATQTHLGSLLALHHYLKFFSDDIQKETPLYKKLLELFSDRKNQKAYPAAVICSMYADTADSQFSKGNDNDSKFQQTKNLHLAYPLGGLEFELSEQSINNDAMHLSKDLEEWSKDANGWNEKTLVEKRNELRDILKNVGERNLAETRLPYNDVTLWQHSYYVAAIFKALLASILLRGNSCEAWKDLISGGDFVNGDLIHAKQHLAMLGVRWDDSAYIARNVRSYDIVGRRAQIYNLTQNIKKLVEDELCLGNEIYHDHQGICFLIPDLKDEEGTEAEKEVLKALKDKLAALCSGEPFRGELIWKLQFESSGLRLTDMLSHWQKPLENLPSPTQDQKFDASSWNEGKDKVHRQQICPRCGLNPIPWKALRTGGENDKACCEHCNSIRQLGAKVLKNLQQDYPETKLLNFAKDTFGLEHLPKAKGFWELIDPDQESNAKDDTRLALIQGLIPLNSLYDGSLFNALLTPLPSKESWSAIVGKISAAWPQIWQQDHINPNEKKRKYQPTETIIDDLLAKLGFGNPKDGWCSDAEENHYQKRWIENLIFDGNCEEPNTPEKATEQAQKILIWALRKHPSPSRMARVWGETRGFMHEIFESAYAENLPFVPLTCDAGLFQILVPSKQALAFMTAIAEKYVKRFGQVRHLLPLHLSASVFYYKAPLYVAMDAAKRFRNLSLNRQPEWWLLEDKKNGDRIELKFKTADSRHISWEINSKLPDGRDDPYHTWFKNRQNEYVPLAKMVKGQEYLVFPSTFDFEILDASTRRYDIHFEDLGDLADKRRPHFMMPHSKGPRPYPLEELFHWNNVFSKIFNDKKISKSQLKTSLELVARIHHDWDCNSDQATFTKMLEAIFLNTLGKNPALTELVAAAKDGTFFDLFEWYDFINKSSAGEN